MTSEEKEQLDGVIRRHNQQLPSTSTLSAWSDIDFLLSLVKEQEAGCGLCGGPHDFDTSVPSVIWNSVIRARDLPDFLCTTCIVREFVRAGQSFTATLWNEEFNGVPIEVVVNGQNAKDATAIQEENNSLRAEIASSAAVVVNEAGKVARLINDAATRMRSRCVEKVKGMRGEWHDQYVRASSDTREALVIKELLYAQCQAATCIAKELESLSIEEKPLLKPKERKK